MASPFTLMAMARRATSNFRQMSYGSPLAPATPAATQDDASDTSSIKSGTGRRAAPAMQTRKASTAAVIDNVTVTSSPPSSPPAAKSILYDVASNGSSATLAHEPTSGLSESPKGGSMDAKPLNDYFSERKSSGSKDQDRSIDVDALEQEKQRLAEQVQYLSSEKKRLTTESKEKEERWGAERTRLITERDEEKRQSEIERNSKERLDEIATELKKKEEQWGAERTRLTAERDEEKQQFEAERNSLKEKLDGLVAENRRLAEDKGELQREIVELQENAAELESDLNEQVKECSRLEGIANDFQVERVETDQTIAALRQSVTTTQADLKALRAQSAKEMEAAGEENRRLSQHAKKEKDTWDLERAHLTKEKADEQRRLEGEKRALDQRIVILGDGLESKEKARQTLEDDLVVVRREKEEGIQVIVALQQELASAKDAIKKLQESAAARVLGLQNDLDRLREERDDQLASKNDYIHSLNATLDGVKKELDQTRAVMNDTISLNNATVAQLQAGLIERDRMVEEVERERNFLRQDLINLGDELAEKEQQRRSLVEDMAYLDREKEEMGATVTSLEGQLTLAAGEIKLLRDTTTAKIAGLEEELRRMHEEREQSSCTIM